MNEPPVLYSVTRAERAHMVAQLRTQGLTYRQIAQQLGISVSYVRALLYDPDGEKLAARRHANQGVCRDCGGPTSGNNGRRHAPKLCRVCYDARRTPEHGTLSRYHTGCSCDACRAAQRDHQRSLKGKPPPTHSASGYTNYGCRCQTCRDAHLVYERAKGYEHQRRYQEKKRQARKHQNMREENP